MSKADFEFYRLRPELPEFVVPKPHCDYYQGLFIPSDTAVALNGLQDAVQRHVPGRVEVIFMSGEVAVEFQNFANQMAIATDPDYMLASHTWVQAHPLAEELRDENSAQEIVFEWMEALFREFAPAKPLQEQEVIAQFVHDETVLESLVARLTPKRSMIKENCYIEGSSGEPTNPWLGFADALPLRVYQWLPGKERKSGLAPTYNPRPFSVLVASSVKIEIINPLGKAA